MGDSAIGLAVEELRASVQRLQDEGARRVRRIRRSAQAQLARRRGQVLGLLAAARQVPAELSQRANQVIRALDARRATLLGTLDPPASGLLQSVVQRLPVASRGEIADLQQRIAALEGRVAALA